MFFTGAPVGVKCYDSDKQANRTMLIGNMIVNSFVGLSTEHRLYLLDRWYKCGLAVDKFAVDNLTHVNLKALGHYLQNETVESLQNMVMKGFAEYGWTNCTWDTYHQRDHYECEHFKVPNQT